MAVTYEVLGRWVDTLNSVDHEQLQALWWAADLEVRKRRQGLKPTPAVASRAVTAASAPAVVPGRPALTAKEAASRIGIASSTLYRRIRSGLYTFLIPGAGREVRIDPDKLEAFLRQEK